MFTLLDPVLREPRGLTILVFTAALLDDRSEASGSGDTPKGTQLLQGAQDPGTPGTAPGVPLNCPYNWQVGRARDREHPRGTFYIKTLGSGQVRTRQYPTGYKTYGPSTQKCLPNLPFYPANSWQELSQTTSEPTPIPDLSLGLGVTFKTHHRRSSGAQGLRAVTEIRDLGFNGSLLCDSGPGTLPSVWNIFSHPAPGGKLLLILPGPRCQGSPSRFPQASCLACSTSPTPGLHVSSLNDPTARGCT